MRERRLSRSNDSNCNDGVLMSPCLDMFFTMLQPFQEYMIGWNNCIPDQGSNLETCSGLDIFLFIGKWVYRCYSI